jgi:phosphatidate cytidylyltransferase
MLGFLALVVCWSLVLMWRGREVRTLWVRYLAWFAIIPPILIPLVVDRRLFLGVVLLLALLCFREYSRAVGLWRDPALCRVCYLGIAAIYLPIFDVWYGLYQAFPIYVVSLILIFPVMRDEYDHMIQKVCLAILGTVYFGWFLSHVAYLRNAPPGVEAIFVLLVLVESNDAFGYLWGTLLGRRPLAPRLSPKKTVEGALLAIVSVIVVGQLLGFLLPFVGRWHLAFLSFLVAVLGLCGDLVISFIKRDLKLKDMGSVIPGHGGLLDRFDSLVLAAPAYFHFLRYFYGPVSGNW